MKSIFDKPLISLVLVSYRQECFIREALKGAFSQTYSPLEIILSDDSSADKTLEIMQEMVRDYKGPHKVILRSTKQNVGLCENLNEAIAVSNGELIVCAAGDDISLPQRCEVLANEWMKPGRKWHSIVSNAEVIDKDGNFIKRYQDVQNARLVTDVESVLFSGIVGVAGCCHAFSRKNIDVFGRLPAAAPGEDELLGFRSLLLGGIEWIPDILLLYRRHGGGLFKDDAELRRMARVHRLKALEEDKRACALRYHCYVEYIIKACEHGVLTSDESACYQKRLKHRLPYYRYRYASKDSFVAAAFYLIWNLITGKYRDGMVTVFKCTYVRFALRSTLRDWLKTTVGRFKRAC